METKLKEMERVTAILPLHHRLHLADQTVKILDYNSDCFFDLIYSIKIILNLNLELWETSPHPPYPPRRHQLLQRHSLLYRLTEKSTS